jgi:RimJ/RimL family protein N-acetyltransferase
VRISATPRWTDGHISLFAMTPELVSDAYIGWLADAEVNRYLELRFSPQGRDSVQAFVATMLASECDLFFGIRDEELDRHVGNIRLGPIDRHHGLAEIGIMIGDRAAWGRGVGSRAIRRLSEIARHELGLRKLSAGCYDSNIGSRRAFEKAGFAVEGVRRGHYLLDGRPQDAILLGRLIDEDEAD